MSLSGLVPGILTNRLALLIECDRLFGSGQTERQDYPMPKHLPKRDKIIVAGQHLRDQKRRDRELATKPSPNGSTKPSKKTTE